MGAFPSRGSTAAGHYGGGTGVASRPRSPGKCPYGSDPHIARGVDRITYGSVSAHLFSFRSFTMKPAVILVGADKGGVGKTTISRAILDYLAAKSIPARAFDTESPRGALHRF